MRKLHFILTTICGVILSIFDSCSASEAYEEIAIKSAKKVFSSEELSTLVKEQIIPLYMIMLNEAKKKNISNDELKLKKDKIRVLNDQIYIALCKKYGDYLKQDDNHIWDIYETLTSGLIEVAISSLPNKKEYQNDIIWEYIRINMLYPVIIKICKNKYPIDSKNALMIKLVPKCMKSADFFVSSFIDGVKKSMNEGSASLEILNFMDDDRFKSLLIILQEFINQEIMQSKASGIQTFLGLIAIDTLLKGISKNMISQKNTNRDMIEMAFSFLRNCLFTQCLENTPADISIIIDCLDLDKE